MIPYPGESMPLWDAVEIIGGTPDDTLYGDLKRRGPLFGDSAPSRTITPGPTWKLFVDGYYDATYIGTDLDIDAEYAWAIEILSGSGTLDLAEVLDPAWGDYGVAVTHSLGSHTVTGPTTLVVPAESFTLAQAYDDEGAFVLQIVCASGSVEVQQVKLRLWPPGGALGGWSDRPAFETARALPDVRGAFVARGGANATGSPPEAAWDAAMLALTLAGGGTGGTGPHPLTTVGIGTTGGHANATPEVAPRVDMVASLDTTVLAVEALPHGVMVALNAPDPDAQSPIAPGLVDGVDYIRPPEEVEGDTQYFAQWTGDRDIGWENATATVEVTGSGADPALSGPTVAATYPSTDPVTAGAITANITEGGTTATQGTSTTYAAVPLSPTGRWVLVSVSHSMVTTAIPWPMLAPFAGSRTLSSGYVVHFGEGTPGLDFDPMRSYVTMPPYQVWNPTAAILRKVRQFHRDDGLGVTPPRAFGGASRIRTGRAYGYD